MYLNIYVLNKYNQNNLAFYKYPYFNKITFRQSSFMHIQCNKTFSKTITFLHTNFAKKSTVNQ